MSLNLYGDKQNPTVGGHGTNIAVQRMDDLDIASLTFALEDTDADAAWLDIGCGFGIQGIRFALLGKKAFLYDIVDISPRIAAVNATLQPRHLQFTAGDVAALDPNQFPATIKCLYMQRFVSFLRYGDMLALLQRLRPRLLPGARLYTTAAGLNSELGNGYAHKELPVAQRFHTLAPDVAKAQNMTTDMCLYTEADLAQLLEEAGFKICRVFSSPFGNIKAEAEV